jgi:hypothetical protein
MYVYLYMPQLQIMKEISITTELMAVGLYSHTLWCARGVCECTPELLLFLRHAISTSERERERKHSGARAAAPIFHSKSLGVKKWRWLRVDYAASADEILRPMMRN